jgi:hypothetical protein
MVVLLNPTKILMVLAGAPAEEILLVVFIGGQTLIRVGAQVLWQRPAPPTITRKKVFLES